MLAAKAVGRPINQAAANPAPASRGAGGGGTLHRMRRRTTETKLPVVSSVHFLWRAETGLAASGAKSGMKCADLFCGAGGAAMGLHRAGFEVEGWDIKPQKHYPFTFHLGDALEADLTGFDFVWASPPCQLFSLATTPERRKNHKNMVPDTRAKLRASRMPFIIENVCQAPLETQVMLCGTMFRLGVFRHRHFESSHLLIQPYHQKHEGIIGDGKFFSIAGSAGRWKTWGTVKRNVSKGSAKEWKNAMGIDWMTRKELTQAIPPAYSEFLGRQIIRFLNDSNLRIP